MVKHPKKLHFGPAGVPLSSKKRDTLNGIMYTYKELNLDGFEIEFTYGVKLREDVAYNINEYLKDKEFILTCHAPYYINLNSTEESKINKSINMLYSAARLLYLSGGYSVVFHPGWYLNNSKEETYNVIKENLKKLMNKLNDESIDIYIRPETMELSKKFGDMDEIIKLSQDIENVLPAVDFAHLRYRSNRNDIECFREILDKIENELGREALDNMHIHMSGIALDKKGTHLNLEESDMPWKDILKLLKEYRIKGIVISESPNIEEDAIRMRDYYKKLE
ncbi:MAG: TIM barrel protein [Candidatus Nanopusillus sp.]